MNRARLNDTSARLLAVLLAGAAVGATTSGCAATMKPDELAQTLSAEDPTARGAAAEEAWQAGPDAIPLVAPMLAHEDPGIARHAERAIRSIANHASRPGADAERAQASSALVAALDQRPPLPPGARGTLLDVLSTTADDATSIRRVGDWLDDAESGEAARRALVRIEHDEAEAVLVERLADGSARAVILESLAERREIGPDGHAAASTFADDPDPAVAAAARRALAVDGEVGSAAALRGASPHDRLRYAERRLRAGDREGAAEVYRALLVEDASHIRSAALVGLGAAGAPRGPDPLLDALEDPAHDVRGAARVALTELPGDRHDAAMKQRYRETFDPTSRAALLLVLAERDVEGAGEILAGALTDSSEEVRITALEQLVARDDPRVPDHLEHFMTRPSEEERTAGMNAQLDWARHRLTSGEEDAALIAIHEVLRRPEAPTSVTHDALRLCAVVADPSSLPVLDEVEREREIDASAARLAVATGLMDDDPEQAKELLEQICFTTGSRPRRQQAAAKLEELGVDTSVYPRRAGFLTEWQVVGPFAEATADDLGQAPFPTDAPPLGRVDVDRKRYRWIEHTTNDFDGVVNLVELMNPREHGCAYAFTEFEWPSTGPGRLKIGSDDGVAVWLNGRLVHENFAWRGVVVDQDDVPVTFGAGVNTILVKVNQGGGGWGFCVRVTDAAGRPAGEPRG